MLISHLRNNDKKEGAGAGGGGKAGMVSDPTTKFLFKLL